jgi:serine/threonine protein kinase
MGNASYRNTSGPSSQAPDMRVYFAMDLPKFILQSKIGNSKFMKTYVMRVDSAQVVVKVYMRGIDEELQSQAARLTHIWKTLSPAKYPFLLPYQMWIKSSSRIKAPVSPVYLVRQFFIANLYDRFSTRPFLNDLEKYWISFQLLKALEICHEHGVFHGDIKPENVMCTTSNWIILTDFGSFKPTLIPDDDPTDFQFYFDSMGRHRCYVAPERFYRREVKSRWSRPVIASMLEAAPSDNGAKMVADDVSNMLSAIGMVDSDSVTIDGNGGRLQTRSATLPSASSPAPKIPLNQQLTSAMDVFSLGCLIAEVYFSMWL